MNVHFIVTMSEKGMEAAEKQGFHEFFKLTTKVNTSNMVCFDFDGKIKKYSAPEEIIEDFYPKRLAYYQKRKVRRPPSSCSNEIYSKRECRITSRMSYRRSWTGSTTKLVSCR